MDNNASSSQSQNNQILPMTIDEDCYMAILFELDEKYWKPKYLRLKKQIRKSKIRAEMRAVYKQEELSLNRQRNYLKTPVVGKKSH